MKYLYEIVMSETIKFPICMKFWTDKKLHDGRRKDKQVELADVKCKPFWIKCISTKDKL